MQIGLHQKRQKSIEWQRSDALFIFLFSLSSVIAELTVLGSLCSKAPNGSASTRLLYAHTLHQIQSITVLKHSEQAGKMECQNDGAVSDPPQIKNPIDWDFRIWAALCPGLCHRFFIRLLAIVTSVYGSRESWPNVSHAARLLDSGLLRPYGRWQLSIPLSCWCIHGNTIAMACGRYFGRYFIIRVSTQYIDSGASDIRLAVLPVRALQRFYNGLPSLLKPPCRLSPRFISLSPS